MKKFTALFCAATLVFSSVPVIAADSTSSAAESVTSEAASTASAPKFAGENGATNGFIGKVHSIAYDNIGLTTIVRIQCIQNVQI